VADVSITPLAEIRRAIAEARRSFDEGVWSDLAPADRAKVLHAFLDHIEAAHEPLVNTLVAEAGQPTRFADMSQFVMGMGLARGTIDLYLALPHEELNPVPVDDLVRGRVALSVRRHEPVGVVSAITPYNAALIMAFQKLIPALMAGNSVILRPSPLTPISSLILGSAADAAGLPHGVLSVVVEAGREGAEIMTTDQAVDMVSFTGSTAVGKQILVQAAPTVKRVALELGGKSAQIYLPDAVQRAVPGAMVVVAMTAGQACVAATRMLVPQERKDEVVEAVSKAYAGIVVGSPTDPGSMMGPVISAAQRERCERYVALAEEHGGKAVVGGGRPAAMERGYYFEPTVLDLPDNSNPAAQDEIFGPVLGILGYRDLDDAVRIANDSAYGLSAQVYGADVAAATSVARRLRTGAVNVNTAVFSAYAPGGGYKQSGLGRERGEDGIRAFQEVKHMAIGELPA
jgi:acyl-CoA reductase-like NAD-dependent aldehyde dehydrogenase